MVTIELHGSLLPKGNNTGQDLSTCSVLTDLLDLVYQNRAWGPSGSFQSPATCSPRAEVAMLTACVCWGGGLLFFPGVLAFIR